MPESNHYEAPPPIDDEQPAVQPPEAGGEPEESEIAETTDTYVAELRDKLSSLNVNEIKTMILLSEGLNPAQIAERLDLALNTSITYKSGVLIALGTNLDTLPSILEQAVELGILDKEKAMAAKPRSRRMKGQKLTRPGPDEVDDNEEAQVPKEPWEDRFFTEIRPTLGMLGPAGFTENPDLLIPINPGPILDELIKSGIVPETRENETPLLDFYAAAIALLLGQKIPRQFLTHPKTSAKAHKIVRELVDYRISVAKSSKLYEPPS